MQGVDQERRIEIFRRRRCRRAGLQRRHQIERMQRARSSRLGILGLLVRPLRSTRLTTRRKRAHTKLPNRLLRAPKQRPLRRIHHIVPQRSHQLHPRQPPLCLSKNLPQTQQRQRRRNHTLLPTPPQRRRNLLDQTLQTASQRQRPLNAPPQPQSLNHTLRRQPDLLSLLIPLSNLPLQPLIALFQIPDLRLQLFEHGAAGERPGLGVGDDVLCICGGESVDAGVDFLDVEEDARERGGEV